MARIWVPSSSSYRTLCAPGWSLLLAAVSGGCALTAFAPLDWWWNALVAVGLLSAISLGQSWRWALLLGGVHGLAFFVPLLYWTGLYVGWFPWLTLAAFEALYMALLGVVLASLARIPARWPQLRLLLPVLIAAAWVAQETLRSALPWGGFPWGRLAFSQADSPLMWWAALGGAPAVSFTVALCGGCVAVAAYYLWARIPALGLRQWFVSGALVLTVIFGVLIGGLEGARLSLPSTHSRSPNQRVTVAVIQGNVPRAGLAFNAQRRAVLNNHVTQTRRLAERIQRGEVRQPDLVIWPENSSDIDPYQDPTAADLISSAAAKIGAPILVGAVLDGPQGTLRNTGIVWDPATGPGEQYVKRHPVPFAEYVPYRSFFRQISGKVDLVRRNFVAGKRPGLLQLGPVRIGDVICFEVAYDQLSADVLRPGAQLFVVQTNNATFGRSAQSAQQLAMVRLRAVEYHRYAVMASTTGISAIVSPQGVVLAATQLFTPAALLREIELDPSRTLATKVGSWPTWIMSLLAAFSIVLAFVAARTSVTSNATPAREKLRASEGDAMVLAEQPTTVSEAEPATDESPALHSLAAAASGSAATAASAQERVPARVLVVVPTFNEAKNLTQITQRMRVAAPDVALLIVDDNSPDGTGEIADALANEDKALHVLHREGKKGLGAAYIAGFSWARENNYDVVVEMDADGSHAPEELPRLLSALENADLVIGSRWMPGGQVLNWPKHRLLLSRLANVYVRLALGFQVKDATGGFRAYRRTVLDAIDFSAVASQGYCFQVDLTWRAFQAGFTITEAPITFTDREHGNSKMSSKIVLEALWLVTLWGIKGRLRRIARLLRGQPRKRAGE
ncbi:MAG: apolipoprotein N-acyltransferase [Mycobacteriales bacterium]